MFPRPIYLENVKIAVLGSVSADRCGHGAHDDDDQRPAGRRLSALAEAPVSRQLPRDRSPAGPAFLSDR